MTVPSLAITLDIDWAPDHVIDRIAAQLIDARVRATWFVTHQSPAIDRLRARPDLFELGIHPNFLNQSTHGETPAEVLAHCMALVPDARSMRTHSLVQSSVLLDTVVRETPIVYDVSLYLPGHAALQPFVQPLPTRPIVRVPFWWEDDFEMYGDAPNWHVTPPPAGEHAGLRILNFHPIHVALNSCALHGYEALKRDARVLRDATADQVAAHRSDDGEGAGTAFARVVSWLATDGGGRTVSQLAEAA